MPARKPPENEVVAMRYQDMELVYDADKILEVSTKQELVALPGESGWAHFEQGAYEYLTLKFPIRQGAKWRRTADSIMPDAPPVVTIPNLKGGART